VLNAYDCVQVPGQLTPPTSDVIVPVPGVGAMTVSCCGPVENVAVTVVAAVIVSEQVFPEGVQPDHVTVEPAFGVAVSVMTWL
jgi:hypothetical protein